MAVCCSGGWNVFIGMLEGPAPLLLVHKRTGLGLARWQFATLKRREIAPAQNLLARGFLLLPDTFQGRTKCVSCRRPAYRAVPTVVMPCDTK
jgi:hypothetical protein